MDRKEKSMQLKCECCGSTLVFIDVYYDEYRQAFVFTLMCPNQDCRRNDVVNYH